MNTHAICQEKTCQKEFDYELKVGYPRKYCPECSAIKKASYNDMQNPITTPAPASAPIPTVKPGYPNPKLENIPKPTIKEPTGEYQSLVYNKTLSANSYEVGKSGDRFKLYFETVEELKAKIAELKAAGFMTEEIDFEKEAKDAFNGK